MAGLKMIDLKIYPRLFWVGFVLAALVSHAEPVDPGPAWARGFETLPEPEKVEALEKLWRSLRFDGCTDQQVPPLLGATHDGSYRVRKAAIRSLAMCGETAAAIDIAARWRQIFDDPTETRDVKRSLIGAMAALGVADSATLERLVSVARDPDDRVFSQLAVAALGVLGVATESSLEVVLAKLDAGPRSPRVTALVALKGMVPSLLEQEAKTLEAIVAAVCRHLPSPDVDVNQQAAFLLGSLGDKAATAVPTLLEVFRERRFSRPQVAYAFGEIGPPAAAAIPLLREASLAASGAEKATLLNALERLTKSDSGLEEDSSIKSEEKQP